MTEIVIASAVLVGLILGLTVALLLARGRLVPQGSLQVLVNDTKALAAQRGDSLLEVLHRNNVLIPAACGGSGTCGLCRVVVTGSGAGEPQATERGILSPKERRSHVRLACQTKLRGSCSATVPADFLNGTGGFACRVVSTRMLAPLIKEIILEIPPEQPWSFRAGGFLQLSARPFSLEFSALDLPDRFRNTWRISGWSELRVSSDVVVTRAYSIASRPEDIGRAVFNIRLAVPPPGREGDVPPGIVSSWLFSREVGDTVDASGPFGEFFVQPTNREMVFVGGGVGMAPLRAMIHEQLQLRSDRKMRYFYGARSAADLFYVDEFADLSKRHDRFAWTPVLSDPAPGDNWLGETGFVHEVLAKFLSRHPAPEDCEYYLCGPPVMISAVRATLKRLGVESSSIFFDDFGV